MARAMNQMTAITSAMARIGGPNTIARKAIV